MLSQDFIQQMQERLQEEKERINDELSQLSEHTEMGSDVDSNMGEINVDEVNQDIIAQLKEDLEKIDKALAKIQSGTYGTTDDGKEISEARLEVLPWADSIVE